MVARMSEDVFISHVQEDGELAALLHDALENRGISCWLASRDIKKGAIWSSEITRAIDACQVLMFILSVHSNRDPKEVLRELHAADARGIPILCVNLDGVMPDRELKYFLLSQQLANVSCPPSEMQIDEIRSSVTHYLSYQQRFIRKFSLIEKLLRGRNWAQSAVESIDLIGGALKHYFNSSEDSAIRRYVREFNASHTGTPQEENSLCAVDDLSFAQLIDLFSAESMLQDHRRICREPLHRIMMTNWQQLVSLEQRDSGMTWSEDEARLVASWAKNIIYELHLVGNAAVPRDPLQARVKKEAQTCGSCSSSIQDSWKFCANCGGRLNLVCRNCQEPLRSEWKRCPCCETLVELKFESLTEMQKAEDEYRLLCRGAWLDGVLTVVETRMLMARRIELGLSSEVALRIERECAPQNVIDYRLAVECVLIDGIITDVEREFLNRKMEQLGLDPDVASEIEKVGQSTVQPAV